MSSTRPLLLMDLDRTLFDTPLFFESVWAFVETEYGVDAETQKNRAKEFFRYVGDMYDYRFFEHVEDAVGERYERGQFLLAVKERMTGNFLYHDVSDELIRRTDAIVTFGNEAYQELKLSLCPELADIPRHIVQEPKGTFIARTFSEPCVLVDDKPIFNEISPPTRFIRLDRSQGELLINQEGRLTVASLAPVLDLIDKA